MDMTAFSDASLDLIQLGSMLNVAETRRAPAWYNPKHYRKPEPMHVATVAKQKFEQYSLWRASVRLDMELLRLERQGIFKNDEDAYRMGYLDDWQSIMLVEDFNLAVSIISGIDPYFPVPVTNDEDAVYARQKRAAVQWLYKVAQDQINRGNEMPAHILAVKYLLGWGQMAKRVTLNTYAETGENPFYDKFIDPTELVVDWEGERGAKRVYRRYNATVAEVCEAYGDLSDAQTKKLKDMYGADLDDETEITDIDEYWDRRYRLVTVGGCELVPPTEHDYFEPPFVIQPGPFGMPRSASLPQGNGWGNATQEDRRKRIQHQSLSYIAYTRVLHLQNEAWMKRMLLDETRRQNPPIERARSTRAANKPLKPFQYLPNDVNESEFGEEEVRVLRIDPPGASAQMLAAQQQRDMSFAFANPGMLGEVNTSNLSGTAYRGSVAQSHNRYLPWIGSLKTFIQRESEYKLRMLGDPQRLDAIEYALPGRVKPVVFPMTRKLVGEQSTARLTSDFIQRVGPHVEVRMVTQDKDTWPALTAVAAQLNQQLGVPPAWLLDNLFQIPYDDAMAEEAAEARAMRAMEDHPKAAEIFFIPARIRSEIVENQGNTAYVAFLEKALADWENYISGPVKQEVDATRMAQQQAQQQQMNPATSEGVAFQDTGQGPGSVTGQMGGPRGPLGPRGLMPQIGAG